MSVPDPQVRVSAVPAPGGSVMTWSLRLPSTLERHVHPVSATGPKAQVLASIKAVLDVLKAVRLGPPSGWGTDADIVIGLEDEGTVDLINAAFASPSLDPSVAGVLRRLVELSSSKILAGRLRFALVPHRQDAELEGLVAVEVARLEKEARKAAARAAAWQLPADDASWVEANGALVVYTDGASINQTGFSSWGWYVDSERFNVGTCVAATSSYVETRAALEALLALPGPVLLVTDCADLFAASSGRIVDRKEARVRKRLRSVARQRQVRVLHVKGHADCPGNVKVDSLVSSAAAALAARMSALPSLERKLLGMYEDSRSDVRRRRFERNERRMRHEELYGPLFRREPLAV